MPPPENTNARLKADLNFHQNLDSDHFSVTYKEAGPEWAGLSDASRGGEGHACEGETQDHSSQAQVAQTQIEEQPGPTRPPTGHASTAVGPTPRPRGRGHAAGV